MVGIKIEIVTITVASVVYRDSINRQPSKYSPHQSSKHITHTHVQFPTEKRNELHNQQDMTVGFLGSGT